MCAGRPVSCLSANYPPCPVCGLFPLSERLSVIGLKGRIVTSTACRRHSSSFPPSCREAPREAKQKNCHAVVLRRGSSPLGGGGGGGIRPALSLDSRHKLVAHDAEEQHLVGPGWSRLVWSWLVWSWSVLVGLVLVGLVLVGPGWSWLVLVGPGWSGPCCSVMIPRRHNLTTTQTIQRSPEPLWFCVRF